MALGWGGAPWEGRRTSGAAAVGADAPKDQSAVGQACCLYSHSVATYTLLRLLSPHAHAHARVAALPPPRSVEMLQGVETDGELGLGWDGATDSDENPTDARLLELMAAEGMDDKIEVRRRGRGGAGVAWGRGVS